jgi:hypothetical protein
MNIPRTTWSCYWLLYYYNSVFIHYLIIIYLMLLISIRISEIDLDIDCLREFLLVFKLMIIIQHGYYRDTYFAVVTYYELTCIFNAFIISNSSKGLENTHSGLIYKQKISKKFGLNYKQKSINSTLFNIHFSKIPLLYKSCIISLLLK